MKFSTFPRNRRRGSVLPLVALSLTVLLGITSFAVDYSVLLADKNQLQRGCDAAALAGAAYLKRAADETANTTNAREQALLVAAQNALPATEVTSITFLDGNTKIRVVATRARSLFFARVMGIGQRNVGAFAVAGTAGTGTVTPVPIAITPTSKARYQNDRLPHTFTLVRPQDTAFQTNYSGLTPFDPFAVFDLSPSQAKSTEKMERQLAGEDYETPKIGNQLTNIAANLDTQAGAFKAGISPRFQKAAGTPWLDPATGSLPLPWQTVGTRLSEVLSGGSSNNPRIVSFVVIEEVATPVSNYNSTIQDFATAYISSVQNAPGGGVTFTATFLPSGSGGARRVTLIE